MAVEIKVPELGESIIEATVARWIKKEGDSVSAGEPVVELETDKVNLEVNAQQAGVIEKIMAQEGATVQVGEALATLRAQDGDGSVKPAAESAAPAAEKPAAQESAPHEQGETPEAKQKDTGTPAPVPSPARPSEQSDTTPTGGTSGSGTATPVALRAARELGVDIAQVQPSGAGGRVTREDVEAFANQRKAGGGQQEFKVQQGFSQQVDERSAQREKAAAKEAGRPSASAPAAPAGVAREARGSEARGRETRERMTRRRQTIARRLVEAQQTAAMLTTFNEVDMSAVMSLRKRRREGFKERYGVDLGFMSFFVKATVAALREFPYVNAEIAAGQNGQDEIVVKHYYDIGIAIGAEEGLVVPVIRDADALSFAGIEKAIRAFVDKVKQGTLTIDDLRGGTFTITNGGVYGSLMSTPILNPPQVGILGMHAIKERPVVVDGEIVARPMMYTALSYDHRLVDGQTAVRFLVRLKEFIEDPEALLFG